MQILIDPAELPEGKTVADLIEWLANPATTTPLEVVEERLASPASPTPAAAAASAPSPAPSGSAPSPSEASEQGQLPQRTELIALARTALQGGRRDAVKTLLERTGVKRMSEIPDDALTDAITELKELLS